MQTFRRLSDHFDLVPAAINRQLSGIDIARGRQEAFALQHPTALESLKQAALIQSVEASNAIENITAPRRRIEELVGDGPWMNFSTVRRTPGVALASARDTERSAPAPPRGQRSPTPP